MCVPLLYFRSRLKPLKTGNTHMSGFIISSSSQMSGPSPKSLILHTITMLKNHQGQVVAVWQVGWTGCWLCKVKRNPAAAGGGGAGLALLKAMFSVVRGVFRRQGPDSIHQHIASVSFRSKYISFDPYILQVEAERENAKNWTKMLVSESLTSVKQSIRDPLKNDQKKRQL